MVRDVFASLRAEWSENPSVRIGVLLIAGILWLYGLLVWFDSLVERDRALTQKERQLARLEAQAAETEWPQRVKEAEGRLLRFESSVKVVDSLGQAQADLQDWLNEQARTAALKNVAVILSGGPLPGAPGGASPIATITNPQPVAAPATTPPAASMPGPANRALPLGAGPEVALGLGWVVRARLQADFAPVAAYDLLAALSSGSRRVWVESMSIRTQPAPRWELQIASAYRSPSAEARK